MEPEIATPVPRPRPFFFFNDRGLRAGWRLLIFISVLIVLAVIATLAFKLVSMALNLSQGRPQNTGISPLGQGLGELALFLLVFLATWIMARIERRKMAIYGLPLARFALSRFIVGYVAWGFLPLTLVLAVMRLVGVFYFGSVGIRGTEALQWAVAWGLVFLSVGLVEEYMFRGYVLFTLADGIGFWPAAIVLAVLFGCVHLSNGGETSIGIIGASLFALFAAATLRLTGNLWLAVGAHAGWDCSQSYFYGVNDSGLQVPGHLLNPHVQGPAWLSGGTVGPEGSILTLILWALMTVGVLILYRRRRSSPLVITTERPPEIS